MCWGLHFAPETGQVMQKHDKTPQCKSVVGTFTLFSISKTCIKQLCVIPFCYSLTIKTLGHSGDTFPFPLPGKEKVLFVSCRPIKRSQPIQGEQWKKQKRKGIGPKTTREMIRPFQSQYERLGEERRGVKHRSGAGKEEVNKGLLYLEESCRLLHGIDQL